MILRLALRSLAVRPIRTAVLACGFGLGIAVMAELLGVGDVILDQAKSPALQGGGDLVVSGAFGAIDNAPYVLSVVRGMGTHSRVVAASPSRRASMYLIKPGMVVPILARGGVPSLERAVGDKEAAGVAGWTDVPADVRCTIDDPAQLLRSGQFHRPPDLPEFPLVLGRMVVQTAARPMAACGSISHSSRVLRRAGFDRRVSACNSIATGA